jgi:hypothetical protein
MKTPRAAHRCAVLGAVKTEPLRGGLRPVLTAPVRGAFRNQGRDGETARNRTEKHCLTKATPNLQNLTHTTFFCTPRKADLTGNQL